jgi:hypothetical protein
LLQSDGRPVTKEAILSHVWRGRLVWEHSLILAVRRLRLALVRDPRYVAAWCALGAFHVARAARMVVPPREAGAAAAQAAQRALQLDAACAPALALHGWVRACIELDVDAGLEDLARSLEITGNHSLSRGLHGWVPVAAGRRAAATAPDTLIVHGALARALARAGRRREAEQLIRPLEAEPLAAAGMLLTGAHVALGSPRHAIDRIAEAREIGEPQFPFAFVDPGLAALRGVPAFERLRPRGKWSG